MSVLVVGGCDAVQSPVPVPGHTAWLLAMQLGSGVGARTGEAGASIITLCLCN